MSNSIGGIMNELGLRIELHRILSDPNCLLRDAHRIGDQIAELRSAASAVSDMQSSQSNPEAKS
jgi:hypothetical protein